MNKGADFSDCRKYRYALWRIWGSGGYAAFIGLNPSTADETEDDPTIRRCIGFAKSWGMDGMYMLNLFAYRATNPADMKRVADPVGPENDLALVQYASDPKCRLLVAAWGAHGGYRSRGWIVKKNVLAEFHMKCLGTNRDGSPRHPLYVPAAAKLEDL